jgi:amino-acid N-acetyltransferase
MTMEIAIERATDADRTAILALLRACRLPPDGVLDHLATTVVARLRSGEAPRDEGVDPRSLHDRVVGTAALEVYADGALLRSVAVDEAVRGQGVGRQLTSAVLDLAKATGVPAVYLLTTTAEGYFPKFAFSRISRDQVPPGVRQSVEFRAACPASAIAMRKTLG